MDAGTSRPWTRLKSFHDNTAKDEIAVRSCRHHRDRDIFDYCRLLRACENRFQEDDNPGLLLTVAINDRKYFTQVSRDARRHSRRPRRTIQRQYRPGIQAGTRHRAQDTVEAYPPFMKYADSTQHRKRSLPRLGRR
jgi:hypothetical protein